jgi:hypothetical protein
MSKRRPQKHKGHLRPRSWRRSTYNGPVYDARLEAVNDAEARGVEPAPEPAFDLEAALLELKQRKGW